jgi:hypothetical protein
MRKGIVGVGVVALAAATLGVGATAGAAPSAPQKASVPAVPSSTDCFKTFQSGSGASFFRWCFSNTGNVVSIESPVTFEHIHIGTIDEGYAVCASGVTSAYDIASHGSGWGPASFTAPNKITRSTLDGAFKLVQVFTQDVSQRAIFITSTLTNTSGASKANILLSRAFDGDLDNTPANDIYVQTKASVLGFENHGLMLTTNSFTTNHLTQIETFGGVDSDTGCLAAAPVAGPTPPGDYAGRATYLLGALGPGQSKTVVFKYSLV